MRKIINNLKQCRSIFKIIALFVLLLPIILWITIVILNQTDLKSNIEIICIKIIIFITYLKLILDLLKSERKLDYENNKNIKNIYLVFGFIYCLFLCLDFAKEEVDIMIIKNTSHIDKIAVNINEILESLWGVFNSIKEAILAAIIFDVIFQINGFSLKKTQEEFLQELITAGRLYILKEDKNKNKSKFWYIRGDACDDIVDYCEKYNFIQNRKYEIELTNEHKRKIIEERKLKGFQEEDEDQALLYDSNEKIEEIYFDFTLIDLGNINKNLYKANKNRILEFPRGTKCVLRKNISLHKKIKKILVKRK